MPRSNSHGMIIGSSGGYFVSILGCIIKEEYQRPKPSRMFPKPGKLSLTPQELRDRVVFCRWALPFLGDIWLWMNIKIRPSLWGIFEGLGMTPLPAKVCCWHVAFTRHIFNYVLRPFAALALGDQSMILGWKRWVLGAGSPEERLASTPKSGSSWNYPWDSTKSASLAVSFNDTTKAWLAWKMTYYIILHHITSYYIILHNITSYHIILHHITPYCTILHYITPYYTILHHIVSYYIILHHITPYCTILHYITPYYTMLHHITSYCIILHHIISYYTIWHHITSYYIIFHHITSYYIILYHRRKFRSQTSDNMDRWKAE